MNHKIYELSLKDYEEDDDFRFIELPQGTYLCIHSTDRTVVDEGEHYNFKSGELIESIDGSTFQDFSFTNSYVFRRFLETIEPSVISGTKKLRRTKVENGKFENEFNEKILLLEQNGKNYYFTKPHHVTGHLCIHANGNEFEVGEFYFMFKKVFKEAIIPINDFEFCNKGIYKNFMLLLEKAINHKLLVDLESTYDHTIEKDSGKLAAEALENAFGDKENDLENIYLGKNPTKIYGHSEIFKQKNMPVILVIQKSLGNAFESIDVYHDHNEGSQPYWLANWSGGDPARTLDKNNARTFKTSQSAKRYRTRIVNENQHRYRGLDINKISVIEPLSSSTL